MKKSMKKRDFAIRDVNSGLFVQCWTEGDTIFLTPNWEEAEKYISLEDAISVRKLINSRAQRFLRDEDESQIPNNQISLSVGKIIVQIFFDKMG